MNADDAWQEFKKAIISERAVKKASVSEKLDVISAQLVQNQAKMDELDGKIDSISAPSDDGGMGAGAPPAPGGMPGGGLAALLGGMGGGAPPGGEEQGEDKQEGGGQGVPPMAGAAGPGKEAFQASATKKKLRSRSSIAKDSFAQSAIGMTSGEDKKQALIDQLLETLKDEPHNQKLIEVLNAERSQSDPSKKKSIAKIAPRARRDVNSSSSSYKLQNASNHKDTKNLGYDKSVLYIMSRLFPNISGRCAKWGYKLKEGTKKIEPIDQTGKSKKQYEDECTKGFYDQFNLYMETYRTHLDLYRTTVEGQTYSIMNRLKDLTTYFNQTALYREVKKRRKAYLDTEEGATPPEGSMSDAAMINFMDTYVHNIYNLISEAYKSNKIIKNPCSTADRAIIAKKYASGKLSNPMITQVFREAQGNNGLDFWDILPTVLLNAGSKGITPILANSDVYSEPPHEEPRGKRSTGDDAVDLATYKQQVRAQRWRQACNMLESAKDYLISPAEFADYLALAKQYGLDKEGTDEEDIPQDDVQAQNMIKLKDHPIVKKATMSMYILNNLATDGMITRMVKELKADLSIMSGGDLDYVESALNQCATDVSGNGGEADENNLLLMLTGKVTPKPLGEEINKATPEQCLNLLVAILGAPPELIKGSPEMLTKWYTMQSSVKSKLNNIVKDTIDEYNASVEGLFGYVFDAKKQGYEPTALTDIDGISKMDLSTNINTRINQAISNGTRYEQNLAGRSQDLEEINKNLDKISYVDGTIGGKSIEEYLERYTFEIPNYAEWATKPPSKSQMTRSSIEEFNKIEEPLRGIVEKYLEARGITLDDLPHDAQYYNILGVRTQQAPMPKSGAYKQLWIQAERRDRRTEMNRAIKNRLDFMRCRLGYESVFNRKYNLDPKTMDMAQENLFVGKAIQAIQEMDGKKTYDQLRAPPEGKNGGPPEISDKTLLNAICSSPVALSAFLTACAYKTDNPRDYLPEKIELGADISEPDWKIQLKAKRNLSALDGYLNGASRNITHSRSEDPMWEYILELRDKIKLIPTEDSNRPRPYEFFQNYEPDDSLFDKLKLGISRNPLTRSTMATSQKAIMAMNQEINGMQFGIIKREDKKIKKNIQSEILHAFEIAIYMNLLQGQSPTGALESALNQVSQVYDDSLKISKYDKDNTPIKTFDLDAFLQEFYNSSEGIVHNTLKTLPDKKYFTDNYWNSWWIDPSTEYGDVDIERVRAARRMDQTHDYPSIAAVLNMREEDSGWYNSPEARAALNILRAKTDLERLRPSLKRVKSFLEGMPDVDSEDALKAYQKVRGIWGGITDMLSHTPEAGLNQKTRKLLESGIIKTKFKPYSKNALDFFRDLNTIVEMKKPNEEHAQEIKDAFGKEWEDYVKAKMSLQYPDNLGVIEKMDLEKSVDKYQSYLNSLGISDIVSLYKKYKKIVSMQNAFDQKWNILNAMGVTQIDISKGDVPKKAVSVVKEYRALMNELGSLKDDWDKTLGTVVDDSLNIEKSELVPQLITDIIYNAVKYEKEMNKYAKSMIDLKGAKLPIEGFDGIDIDDESEQDSTQDSTPQNNENSNGDTKMTKKELFDTVKKYLTDPDDFVSKIPKNENAKTYNKNKFMATLPLMVRKILNYQPLGDETARYDESENPTGKIKQKKKNSAGKYFGRPKIFGVIDDDPNSIAYKWYKKYEAFSNQTLTGGDLDILTGNTRTIGAPELSYNQDAVNTMYRILNPLTDKAKEYFDTMNPPKPNPKVLRPKGDAEANSNHDDNSESEQPPGDTDKNKEGE